MTAGLTPAAVATASAAWNWYPTDATTVETDGYLLVRWPGYFRSPPHVIRFDPAAPVEETLDEVAGHVRGWGHDEVLVWVKLDAPPALEPSLRSRGGTIDETVDVFALDLTAGSRALDVPDDLEVRWQVDEATTRAVIQVGIEAFDEGSMPGDDRVRELAAEARADFDARRTAGALVYLDGRPVAAGGLTMAGDVARLWGGGVVPDARGRGAYRAILAARLDHAVSLGATTALVKGRVETSGPVLRRAGFAVFGQERSYVVPVAPLVTAG
ncbi:GNAT family N-acetyltransferase [Nocardioides sp.]|uniref:GNAT family N-acetyltransferase n=1 Tax=Nocardioides sp. TaxID=35761 RepID=UPI002727D4BA|nr:GNAT family N-acetyltransferase [Nocardioides sp.]MDO9457986.1 GNAT family N-acetyltransferase [Nocardioides sp.]